MLMIDESYRGQYLRVRVDVGWSGYNIDVYVFGHGGSSSSYKPAQRRASELAQQEQGSSSSCSPHCYSGHGELQPKPEMKMKRVHSGQKSDGRNSRRSRHRANCLRSRHGALAASNWVLDMYN